jgi:hypothetical protein
MFHAAYPFKSAVAQRLMVMHDLEQSGCVVNHPKSFPIPRQRLDFIGATVDSVAGTLLVPQQKRERVLLAISNARKSQPSVHTIESIVGQLVSLHYSFSRISIMMTRDMAGWVTATLAQHGQHARYRHFPLSAAADEELAFWQTAFQHFEGIKPLWRPPFVHTIIHTDAAGDSPLTFGGWGGWARYNGALLYAAGRWPWPTSHAGSTLLELKAIHHTLESFCSDAKLDGHRILLRSDNQGVKYIVNKGGSMKAHLNEVVRQILWFTLRHGIDLLVEWIPREENELADFLSKQSFSSDWKLEPAVFNQLSRMHGPFHTDLFASHTNHQLPRFFSLHHAPGAAGINAFAQHWGQQEWCNPPFALVGRAIQHARACSASMCLIAPYWPNAKWWHELVHAGACFKPFVRACTVLPRTPHLFLSLDKHSPPAPSWHTMALFIDFAHRYQSSLPLPQLPAP